METKVEATPPDTKQGQPGKKEPPFALLLELEGMAHGRRAAFAVLQSILKEHRVALEPHHFSRYCLHPSPARYVARLLAALNAKVSADRLAEDVNSGVTMHLTSNTGALRPGFSSMLDAASARGMAVAVLTALDAASAESIVEKLGLKRWNVRLFPAGDEIEDVFPRADTWLKIAKALETTPRRCVVIATHKASTRAALSAGMSCVVVPDEFTAFQDFGGANVVLDSLEDVPPAELLEQVCPKDA